MKDNMPADGVPYSQNRVGVYKDGQRNEMEFDEIIETNQQIWYWLLVEPRGKNAQTPPKELLKRIEGEAELGGREPGRRRKRRRRTGGLAGGGIG